MTNKRTLIVSRCDQLFRKLVLIAADNRCQATGQWDIPLEVHHLVCKRRKFQTRWLLDNGVAVSISAHARLGNDPVLNRVWGRRLLGDLQYDYILSVAREQVPLSQGWLLSVENDLNKQIIKWKRASEDPDFFLNRRKAIGFKDRGRKNGI